MRGAVLRDGPTWEAEVTTFFACAYHGGETTYHDTERAAESAARELVAAKKTTAAYVYPIDVEETA